MFEVGIARQGSARFNAELGIVSSLFMLLGVALFVSSFNPPLFYALNARLVPWLGEPFWAVITNLGDGFFLFPLAMMLFWRSPQQQLATLLSMLALAAAVNVLKVVVGLPRPFAELGVDWVSMVGPLPNSKSFPSGHSGTAFLLVGLSLMYFKSRLLKGGIAFMATMVCLSRIAVGVHWPSDILFGIGLGISCALLGGYWSQRVQPGFKARLIFILLGSLSVGVLPGYNNGFQHYSAVLMMQYTLAVVAVVAVLSELLWLYRDYRD